MRIFIHYIYGEEDEEMESAVEALVEAGFEEIYSIPVESHDN